MALAITAKSSELALHFETATPGTYSAAGACGITDFEFTMSNETAESMIPDCDDETKPYVKEREVIASEWSLSGTGVWAQTSHEALLQWWKTGAVRNVRIVYAKAAVGDVEFVTGPAILTSITHAKVKGQRVTAQINIVSAGDVTLVDQT
jgi:predicted secreted protein